METAMLWYFLVLLSISCQVRDNTNKADVKPGKSTVFADATSKSVEVHCNFSVGEETRRHLQDFDLHYKCGFESDILIKSNPSTEQPAYGRGGHLFRNNFTAVVNLTYLRTVYNLSDSFCIACAIRVNNIIYNSNITVIQDCRETVAEWNSYNIAFTDERCSEDSAKAAVVEFLLKHRTCLKYSFNLTLSCLSEHDGVLKIYSNRRILLSSLQHALHYIGMVSNMRKNETSGHLILVTTELTLMTASSSSNLSTLIIAKSTSPNSVETEPTSEFLKIILFSCLSLFFVLAFLMFIWFFITIKRSCYYRNKRHPVTLPFRRPLSRGQCETHHNLSSQPRSRNLLESSDGVHSFVTQIFHLGISGIAALLLRPDNHYEGGARHVQKSVPSQFEVSSTQIRSSSSPVLY